MPFSQLPGTSVGLEQSRNDINTSDGGERDCRAANGVCSTKRVKYGLRSETKPDGKENKSKAQQATFSLRE